MKPEPFFELEERAAPRLEPEPITLALDDLGNFEAASLPPDRYVLEVFLPDQVIVVEALQVD